MARSVVRRSLITAAAIVSGVAWTRAVAQPDGRPTRILLLFQQQAETPPMMEFTQPLRSEVQRGLKGPVEFFQESLDLDRFAGRERSSELKSYLASKYGSFGLDVVVAVGGRALDFATAQLADVLSGVPIVFALTTAPQTDPATLPPNVTGRLGLASRFAPTFDMARRLQPDAERVVIVGGAGAPDSASVRAALDAVEGSSLPVSLLVGLSLDTLLTRLHNLPRRSIVIFANFRRDALGQVFDPFDLVGTIARASAAPMYTQLRSYVGEGTVGGWILKFDDEGRRTGNLIVRVLGRRSGEPLPPIELLEKTFLVDWRALRRWGLDERRLPTNTEVLFREPSLWTRYRSAVLLTVIVISGQLALIGLLLLERQRRKRAQSALQEQSAYEKTIARLTTDAVRHAPEEAPHALEDALAHVAEYAGASSATLVQNPDTAGGPPRRLAWTVPTNGNDPGDPAITSSGSEPANESRLEIPLVADGLQIGALELHHNDSQGWPAPLIRRLDSAGEVIASAMARARAVRDVRRGEELNRAVLASLSTQIAILDANGTIIRVNEAWRGVAPCNSEATRDGFVGANYLDECRLAELRGCDGAGHIRAGIEAVLERRAWPFRYEYHCPEPTERWYELFVDRLLLPEGGAIVTLFEITDRRLAERRAEETRRQVAHMGRMALVGELAATISHELRQPLAAIRVNAEAGAHLLSRIPAETTEAREIFESIVADDARAVELIEGVRKLLRKEDSETTTVDLNQVCRDAVRLLQHDAGLRGTRLDLVLAPESPHVTGDRVQLQQVILNLALNGLEAASTSTTERSVTVATDSKDDCAEVIVRDSGAGIPTGVQPHLFESFFSTKTGGLGLGLVIVRSIVERHSGRILVENQPGGGALFRVRFPILTATPDLSGATSSRAGI